MSPRAGRAGRMRHTVTRDSAEIGPTNTSTIFIYSLGWGARLGRARLRAQRGPGRARTRAVPGPLAAGPPFVRTRQTLKFVRNF